MSSLSFPPQQIISQLRKGTVIPAHPLALNRARKLDERRQRALTRYYCDAGAGGIAVGVHTTQFEIHEPEVGLYQPVLELAAETLDSVTNSTGKYHIRIAGITGPTDQAVREARLAVDLKYHLGLVSLGALRNAGDEALLHHLRAVAEIIPIMGFYLQPAVGGLVLSYEFWRKAVEIENLLAVKIAPFNRYYTLDVVRAVAESGRADEIALYTGNDDNIVIDLLSEYRLGSEPDTRVVRMVGGLLGHWACWTKKAVELLEEVHEIVKAQKDISPDILTLAQQITDANSAIFDPQNSFAGCIPGIHEILRRQGLLEGRWTLNPGEQLSSGQLSEIQRIYSSYPYLNDDEFVREHIDDWLK
ncbi:dihydrodipicolinate synthase family protein [candidate division KSB1 bacterium]|nr:dihydrodipicolinate synthase family protein [candidate division KSB1 bacterium]NIV70789.1 dihydrodipicolinate synthase family protein [Phycisphaerae bacterium]NIR72907.1 dihydrodipicolinate synthase family protein [candidate division KSB1 bacterium]NIT73705.1 dihydrodipicolinate synthase family protein [candidate division KSB1 bacterium]NIU27577.1 dihydrodipicolinate synthase family protein [candidate division KSB1 bacterium]